MSHTYAASRVTDWRPEPPTPASRALPRGICSTRDDAADVLDRRRGKSTSFIGLDEIGVVVVEVARSWCFCSPSVGSGPRV